MHVYSFVDERASIDFYFLAFTDEDEHELKESCPSAILTRILSFCLLFIGNDNGKSTRQKLTWCFVRRRLFLFSLHGRERKRKETERKIRGSGRHYFNSMIFDGL